jgi:hypothetical protein
MREGPASPPPLAGTHKRDGSFCSARLRTHVLHMRVRVLGWRWGGGAVHEAPARPRASEPAATAVAGEGKADAAMATSVDAAVKSSGKGHSAAAGLSGRRWATSSAGRNASRTYCTGVKEGGGGG